MVYSTCLDISISSESTLTDRSIILIFFQMYHFKCTNFRQSMRGMTMRLQTDLCPMSEL